MPVMSLRSEIAEWAWGIAFAMPAVGLFLACKLASGWVSVAALVLLVTYVGVGFGYAVVAEARAWGELEDEFDGRDYEDDQT